MATANRERAIELLGCGLDQVTVAASLGVTEGYISQLLLDPQFSSAVSERKYKTQVKNNERDNKYDETEDTLMTQLEGSLCMLLKPMEILKAMQIVNGLKRRGISTPAQINQQQTFVQITLPTIAATRFVTDINNQVTKAGSQELETIQSHTLAARFNIPQLEDQNDRTIKIPIASSKGSGESSPYGEGNFNPNFTFVPVK